MSGKIHVAADITIYLSNEKNKMSVFVYVTYRTDIFCVLVCGKNIPARYMTNFAVYFAFIQLT